MKSAFNGKSKVLVSAVAALFATVAYTALAADVQTGNTTTTVQGRQIDDGTVQTDPTKAKKNSRAIEGAVQTDPTKAKKNSRAIEGAVQTDPKKAGNQPPRAIDDDVKAGGKTTDVQGRAVEK